MHLKLRKMKKHQKFRKISYDNGLSSKTVSNLYSNVSNIIHSQCHAGHSYAQKMIFFRALTRIVPILLRVKLGCFFFNFPKFCEIEMVITALLSNRFQILFMHWKADTSLYRLVYGRCRLSPEMRELYAFEVGKNKKFNNFGNFCKFCEIEMVITSLLFNRFQIFFMHWKADKSLYCLVLAVVGYLLK